MSLRLLVLSFLCVISAFAETRIWTDLQGRSFEGDFLFQRGGEVTIRRASDQKEFSLAISKLSESDKEYLRNQETYDQGSSGGSSIWGGKWNNERGFTFEIKKKQGTNNGYQLINTWREQDGSVDHETISGTKNGEIYEFVCIKLKIEGERGFAAARFGEEYGGFVMANLVRLPEEHEPLQDLRFEKYGWRAEDLEFPRDEFRIPLSPNASSARYYQDREQRKVNLFKNGDFGKNSSSWRGDVGVAVDAPQSENRIGEVESKRKKQTFQQNLRVDAAAKIKVNFSYRCSMDYEGEGIEIRFVREGGGFTFYTYDDLPYRWSTKTITFDRIEESKVLEFEVEVKPGTSGSILFDNFSAEIL